MKKQSFLEGAFILMISGLITRVMGFVLRIILVKYVGDEGLGLFQMVYPFYMTLLLISTAGFPVAISKLIPERIANKEKSGAFHLLKVALSFTTFMGVITSLSLYLSADIIAHYLYSDPRTYLIFIAISPALIICPIGATLKGFFQGFHNMNPTSLSRIIEQLTRIIATLIIINMVSSLGLKYQAAAIALGVAVGEVFSLLLLLYMFLRFIRNHKRKKITAKKYTFLKDFKKITKLAVPITTGRLITSLMMSARAILIPRQLKLSGSTTVEATSLYGQLSGMAMQLVLLPTVITIALTTSLIPSISEAYAKNNMKKIKRNYRDIIRITTYLGFPVTIIYISRGSEICNFLFSLPEAGQILSSLALSSTFIYFLHVSSGMLNGLGKPELSVRNLTTGSLIQLSGIYFLTTTLQPGILGATTAITAGYAISAILNFFSIGNIIGFHFDIKNEYFKPLFCSTLLLLINPYLDRLFIYFIPPVKTAATLLCLLILYLLSMLAVKAITRKDIKRFKP